MRMRSAGMESVFDNFVGAELRYGVDERCVDKFVGAACQKIDPLPGMPFGMAQVRNIMDQRKNRNIDRASGQEVRGVKQVEHTDR